jgi:formylglycine-generating enzyme required for sulfatase activity
MKHNRIYMKKFIAFMAILALLVSCGKSLKGKLSRCKWHPEKPYGMTLVLVAIMGKSDDDVANQSRRPKKTVTVRLFMDETEITNSEYRQFVEG